QFQDIPIADENAGEVGEAVPAKVEAPDVQSDRRQAEIRKRNEVAIVDGLQGLPHQSSAPHKAGKGKGKGARKKRCRTSWTAASTRSSQASSRRADGWSSAATSWTARSSPI